MSVTRLYSCDLCHGQIGGLVGIYWGPTTGGPDKITLRPANEVEHHLCKKCVDELMALEFSIPWFNP